VGVNKNMWKVLKWDKGKDRLQIRKEAIRKIIERRLIKFRERAKEEIRKINLEEEIITQLFLEILVDEIERWMRGIISDELALHNAWDIWRYEKWREAYIKELNFNFSKAIKGKLKEVEKALIEKIMEKANKLKNKEQGVSKNGK
jgi:histone H3/H4